MNLVTIRSLFRSIALKNLRYVETMCQSSLVLKLSSIGRSG